MDKFKKVGRVLIPVAMAVTPFLVFALTPANPPLGGNPITLTEIQNAIERIAQILIVVGVVIAVIMIIWGGIVWVTAGGSDTRLESGKKTVKNGIIGAIIVLGVGVILQTIAYFVANRLTGQ